MQQCVAQVPPSELRFFMPPSFQENSYYMQPNFLLPPLKVKQPAPVQVQVQDKYYPYGTMPPLTKTNVNANNFDLNGNIIPNQNVVLNGIQPSPKILKVGNYNGIINNVPPPIGNNIVYTQTNISTSSSNASETVTSEEDSEEETNHKNNKKALDPSEKKDLKERNRIAAQKWRKKKDKYLTELESANDVLRQQALSLCGQMQSLRVENKLLEDELQFFQSFMSKIMNAGPKH